MEVTLIDSMGTDLSVVNAARVSFGKKSEWVCSKCGGTNWVYDYDYEYYCGSCNLGDDITLSKADKGLVQFLARGCTSSDWDKLLDELEQWGSEGDEAGVNAVVNHIRKMPDHWTPFGHTAITLHIKAPIFVARQLGKHQVGFVWNEVSRRYVTDEPEFYVPDTWRKAAENVKQGSSEDPVVHTKGITRGYQDDLKSAILNYKVLTEDFNVCPEQARMVLPQSMYTEWYWTGNLYGFANVFIQRTDSHAQKEVRDVAKQIGDIIKPLFPVSWEALTK